MSRSDVQPHDGGEQQYRPERPSLHPIARSGLGVLGHSSTSKKPITELRELRLMRVEHERARLREFDLQHAALALALHDGVRVLPVIPVPVAW